MVTPEDINEARDAGQELPGGARRFEGRGGGRTPRLGISNVGGAIRVRGAADDRNDIGVRATGPDGAPVALDEVADVSYAPDGDVTVRVRPSADLQRRGRRLRKTLHLGRADFLDNLGEFVEAATMGIAGGGSVEVTIEAAVPRRCDLTLATTSGDIDAAGVEGEVHLKTASGRVTSARMAGKLVVQTASGDIEVGDVAGAVYLQTLSGDITSARIEGNLVTQTASGDVEIEAVAGQLGFKSASGDLDLQGGQLSGLYLNTASGDCTIDAALGPGDYEARTVSGDIELRVQPDFSGLLTGRTLSGSFRSAIPYQHPAGDPRGDDGDPDEEGDDPRPFAPPAPPPPPPPPGRAEGDDRGGPFAEGGFAVPGIRLDQDGIAMPGIRLDWDGISLPGIRLDKDGIDLPGLKIGKRQKRERREGRRRGRNRWEFLLGDPVEAAAKGSRLRVRTVSGNLTIGPGRSSYRPATEGATSGADPVRVEATRPEVMPIVEGSGVPPAPRPTGGWPDSELWPPEGTAESGEGAVELTPSRSDLVTPPAAGVAESQTEALERSRLEILQAIERREITTDEALRLLQQLEV